jgi:hypothetical protein
MEKARRGWAPYSGHAWRDDSYNRFFLPPPQRRTLAEAAAVQARISMLRNPVVMAAAERERQRPGGSLSESRWETAEEEEMESGVEPSGPFRGAWGPDENPQGLVELLESMRTAACPVTTEDCEAAHRAAAAKHWAWACDVDELSLSRKAGVALHGFQEGPLAFPPTFKFFPGRSVEDYADVTDLRYGYQVTKGGKRPVSGSPKGTRPPSWTDRILHHSLPGLESRLLLEAYDTCDAITGSDHRPVVAAFQLLLDKPAGAAAERPPSRATAGGPILPPPLPPPSLFLPRALPRIPAATQLPRQSSRQNGELPPRPPTLVEGGSASAFSTLSALLSTSRPTPPPPQPGQLSRASTTPSSAAGFLPLVPPSALVPTTTKTVLLSVRLNNFAFRFQLPRKPELQIAQQKGRKKTTVVTTGAGPSAEAVAAASAAVAGEAKSAARRTMHATAAMVEDVEMVGSEEQEEEEEEESREGEEFKAPAVWRGHNMGNRNHRNTDSPAVVGRRGVAQCVDEDEDPPEGPDVPAFTSYAAPTMYVTPQLAHNPPSYTRQRSELLTSRPLRAFTGGGGAATAAERRRRAESKREEEAPSPPTEDDIGWVVVMMPIPCEDPYIGHRRIVMMMDEPDVVPAAAAGGGARIGGLGARLSSRLWPRNGADRSHQASSAGGSGEAAEATEPLEAGAQAAADSPLQAAVAAAAEEEEELARQHVHRFSWADVRRGGGRVRLQALVVPAGGMHAAIKFLDKKGHDLGQGVVCLKEVVLRGRAGPQRVTMQLSVGGVHFGDVDMDAVIKSRAAPAAVAASAVSGGATLAMSLAPSFNGGCGAVAVPAGGGGPAATTLRPPPSTQKQQQQQQQQPRSTVSFVEEPSEEEEEEEEGED